MLLSEKTVIARLTRKFAVFKKTERESMEDNILYLSSLSAGYI